MARHFKERYKSAKSAKSARGVPLFYGYRENARCEELTPVTASAHCSRPNTATLSSYVTVTRPFATTGMEKAIPNKVNVKAFIKDEQLTWTITGNENIIDHYTILAQQASQWINAANLPAGSSAAKLIDLHLQPESRALCVQAVGKASMLNHSSSP